MGYWGESISFTAYMYTSLIGRQLLSVDPSDSERKIDSVRWLDLLATDDDYI